MKPFWKFVAFGEFLHTSYSRYPILFVQFGNTYLQEHFLNDLIIETFPLMAVVILLRAHSSSVDLSHKESATHISVWLYFGAPNLTVTKPSSQDTKQA